MKKGLLITIVLMFFVLGCSKFGEKSKFYLSNPTNKEIKLKLDNKEYILAPQTFKKVVLKPGEHNYEYGDDNVNFIVTFESTGGIINPTKNAYVLLNLVYETKNSKTNFMTRINEITINGVVYEVPGTLINEKIMDNKSLDLEFKLDEPFPKSVTNIGNSDGNIYTKIFTIKDFVEFYEEETGETGNLQNIKSATSFDVQGPFYNEEKLKRDSTTEIPDYKTPGLKELAQKVVDLDNAYANATKVSEQKKIIKESQKAWKEYVQLLMKKDEADKNTNDVLNIQNIGRGVIIK